MPYELHLRHYDRTGTLKNAVLEPLWARFTESVSGQEPLVFALDAEHPLVDSIAEFDIFQVMLRNRELGLTDFTPAFVGIQRHWDRSLDDDGMEILEFTAPGERHILSWRHVLWYAGVADRSDFQAVPAETIMKTVVRYNLTALAAHTLGDATTRQRPGDLSAGMGTAVAVATDLARGEVLSLAFQGANVLSVLQKLAQQGGGDFSFVWQGENTADWVFDFEPGQLGLDKSTGAERVLFSVAPGNNTLLRPRLKHTGALATTAIAAGQGDDLTRQVSPVDGPDFSGEYDLETFVDARNEATAAGREFRGHLRLEQLAAREELTFDVLQTANQFYSPVAVTGRKTYRAGDLVLIVFGATQVCKIETVEVDWRAPERGDALGVRVTTRLISVVSAGEVVDEGDATIILLEDELSYLLLEDGRLVAW